MIILSTLINIPLYHSDKDTIGFVGLILMAIQCFLIVVSKSATTSSTGAAEKKRKQFVSSVHIERNSSVSRTQRHIRTVMHLAAGFGVGCAAAYSAGKNYT